MLKWLAVMACLFASSAVSIGHGESAPGGARKRRIRTMAAAAGVFAVALLAGWWVLAPVAPRETAEVEVFEGVWYECLRLTPDSQGGGLVHIVRVDLTAAGVEPWVTPLDPVAVSQGFEYRLTTTQQTADRYQLAVAVNGAFFAPDSRWIALPGDMAVGTTAAVSDGQFSRVSPYAELIWFDAQGRIQPRTRRPPWPAEAGGARWGIASQGGLITDGRINSHATLEPDRRTIIGLDPRRQVMWITAFERASLRRAAELLLERGAVDAAALDGGDSTQFVMGRDAAGGVPVGTLLTSYRPVATHFGIRARPLGGQSR